MHALTALGKCTHLVRGVEVDLCCKEQDNVDSQQSSNTPADAHHMALEESISQIWVV